MGDEQPELEISSARVTGRLHETTPGAWKPRPGPKNLWRIHSPAGTGQRRGPAGKNKEWSFGPLREVLMRLSEIYRAPLVLRYMEGFATKEIARMLGVPLGTILARLHRGRKRFEMTMWAYAEEMGLLLEEAIR